MLKTLNFHNGISGRSNNLSLKYQWFKPPGWKDIVITKLEFVAKTYFLCKFHTKTGACN